jgi:hypothetical protein
MMTSEFGFLALSDVLPMVDDKHPNPKSGREPQSQTTKSQCCGGVSFLSALDLRIGHSFFATDLILG